MTALRYILLAGSDAGEREAVAADIGRRTGLKPVDTARPFTVLTNNPAEVLVLPGSGAIIGTLFHRHGPPRAITSRDSDAVGAIGKDKGGHLLDPYWGGYVAALVTAQGSRIVRAPMGALPCYHVRKGALTAFASDADILVQAGLLEPRIDWEAVGRHLYSRDLPSSRTALAGLSELLPGTAYQIEGGVHRKDICWSPWDHVSGHPDCTFSEQAEQLGRIVQSCIAAWASRYSSILLSVSGGLDSSIVAATLAGRTDRRLICLTLATDDPSGDERHYARAICSHLGAELEESSYVLADVDLARSVAGHLPRPCGRIHELAFRARIQTLARKRGADAYFTGNGGDNVFYNSASVRPIVDRYRVEGVGPGVVHTVRDICAITGCSVWQAAREVMRLLGKRGRAYKWRPETLFLHRDIIQAQARTPMTHPWLETPPNALPGKSGHIAMLLRMQPHLEGYDRNLALPVINPLVSQPIVEMCLGIPSWSMCEGGRNRAAARAAFTSRLPGEILDRRSKAGPDSFIVQLLDHRLPEIHERLLEGALARHGLLDLDLLRAAIATPERYKPSNYMRIMALLDAEAWIGRWAHRTTRPAAESSHAEADG